MNGINLIPAQRRSARRRSARLRLWLSIAPACTIMLAGSYGYLAATWQTGTDEASQALAKAATTIESTRLELASTKAGISETEGRLRALRTISEQPDWGQLLAILSGSLSDSTVLGACSLEPDTSAPAEPAKPATGPKRGPKVPAAASAPAVGPVAPIRPARYRLALSGYARTQEAVPEFVRRLEQLNIFEQTTLVQSIRSPFAGAEAFQFRIECTIADPAAEGL